MAYLLDTNVWIAVMRKKHPAVTRRLLTATPGDVYICSVVKAELFVGAHKSANVTANLALTEATVGAYPSLPFDDAAADRYATIRAALESHGSPIGANDLMIAAIALDKGLVLITNNTREFARVPNLNLEDWQAP